MDLTVCPESYCYCVCCIRSGITRSTHPLYGAQHGSYVLVRVTRGVLVAHRYTFEPALCGTSQYHRTFIPLSVSVERSCWPCIRRFGTGGFQEQGQYFFIGLSCSIHFGFVCFRFLFFLSIGWYRDAGIFILIGSNLSLPALHWPPLLLIILIIIILILKSLLWPWASQWRIYYHRSDCGVNYQLLAVIYWSSTMENF